jgi:hypothetical protein
MMTTGKVETVTNYHRTNTLKPLLVLDGMHLVGLTGQIAPVSYQMPWPFFLLFASCY